MVRRPPMNHPVHPGRGDALLSRLEALVQDHGPCDAARRFVAELTGDEARAFATPYALVLARHYVTDYEEGATA